MTNDRNDKRSARATSRTASEARTAADARPAATETTDATDPRERILATTVELLGEVGWAGVTTRSVASRAKVNNALVHYYFGSMSRLLTEAAKRLVSEVFVEPMAMLADPEVPVADALTAAVAWLGSEGLEPNKLRALVEITVNGLQEPELVEFSKGMVREGRAVLAQRLEHKGLDPARARGVAALTFALLDGLMVHLIMDPSLPLDEVITALEPVFRKE